MDRCRLKNIIILILLLVNVFLLVSLAQRRSAEQDAFRRTAEQLVDLFSGDGMTLDPYAISRDVPPEGVSLTWDTDLEDQAAALLLGKTLTSSDQGGGIHYYAGPAGEALFRSSGAFEASGTLAEEDVEDFCRDFCRTFSFDPPDIRLDETGGGVFSASALYSRLPVFNCSVTFTIENGVLTSVSGTLLPETGTAALVPEVAPLSAAGALVAFQQMRRESVVVASTVTDTRLCYELQNTGAAMSLAPAWRIVTDTEDYYVNCYTGAVSAGGARAGEGTA